ncbi:MAG: DUF255 domain-containing protein [Candidatus Hydrogenedentales bacterium]|jgi:thioredoxin-related protein
MRVRKTALRNAVAIWVMTLAYGVAGYSYAAEAAPIYDESGKGLQQIMHAVDQAKKESKRVLVQFGGNWCGWCIRLHELCQKDATLTATLNKLFVVVLLDTRSNPEVVKSYAPDHKSVPYLEVLDADGNIITTQNTEVFELGSGHDPKKLNDWLTEWGTKPVDSKQVLDTTLSHAAKSDKKVLLVFGAPSCGWCRKLETILHSDAVSPIMFKDYLIAKVDLDSQSGAKELEAKYRTRGGGGIPWFAVLDAKAQAIVTADKPGSGNVGCPARPEEIAWFQEVVAKTGTRITPGERDELGRIFAEETKPKS